MKHLCVCVYIYLYILGVLHISSRNSTNGACDEIVWHWEGTWCGCEVPGMVLLRDLKGAMRLDRRKDTSVRVSACIVYDLDVLTPVVWKVWCAVLIRLCVSTSRRRNERFLRATNQHVNFV
jgi:hypothetical protein